MWKSTYGQHLYKLWRAGVSSATDNGSRSLAFHFYRRVWRDLLDVGVGVLVHMWPWPWTNFSCFDSFRLHPNYNFKCQIEFREDVWKCGDAKESQWPWKQSKNVLYLQQRNIFMLSFSKPYIPNISPYTKIVSGEVNCLSSFKYKRKRYRRWPCPRLGLDNLRLSFVKIIIGFESSMRHPKFYFIGLFVLEKKTFEGFLSWASRPSCSCAPDP